MCRVREKKVPGMTINRDKGQSNLGEVLPKNFRWRWILGFVENTVMLCVSNCCGGGGALGTVLILVPPPIYCTFNML